MAQGGQRVILVDADLRHPSLHEIFGAPNERGLTTLLDERDPLTAPPLLQVADVDYLQLLPGGPPPLDAAAQLGSRRMEDVITALKKRADLVLFGTPPILAAMDAIILGTKVDGVLLAVEAGHTSRECVQQAKERLEKARVHVIGATLIQA